MASKLVICSVLLVLACFAFEANAEDDVEVTKREFSTIPFVFRWLGIGGPFRGIGLACDIFLRVVGFLLVMLGALISDGFGVLGLFLGYIIYFLGIFIQNILSGGVSNAEDEDRILEKRRGFVPEVFKWFGIGGPIRALGVAGGLLLSFIGFAVNWIGVIVGVFFLNLGRFLGTAGHLIGILIQGIVTGGRSNFQFIDAFKAATFIP